MENLIKFITKHANDDPNKLLLSRSKWPDIDMNMAVDTILTRKRLKTKAPSWWACESLIYPYKLASEQCSSEDTSIYKANLAKSIITTHTSVGESGGKIADLTSGMGIDDWAFSLVAQKVLYNDMNPSLVEAARHNFAALGRTNIDFRSIMIEPGKIAEYLDDFQADLIFADPARRGSDGSKVFLIEDCTPDILGLKEEIFQHTRHLLIKLSPMADIAMVVERLGEHCREVHIVGAQGECKELLIWMDREWSGEAQMVVVDLARHGDTDEFRFLMSQERAAVAVFAKEEDIAEGAVLFEPGKALMKSGCFKLLCERCGMKKFGVSTHLYVRGEENGCEATKTLGKEYEIKEIYPFNNKTIKEVGKKYKKSSITARNLPVSSDELRKKMGLNSGSDAHLFALKSDCAGNLLLVTERK